MKKSVWALASAVVALSVGAASAGPVVYEARGLGIEREQVTITVPVGERGITQGTRTPALSSFMMKDEANSLGLGTSFFAWCLDLVKPMVAGTSYGAWSGPGNPFPAPNLLSDTQLARVQAVVNRNFGEVTAADVSREIANLRHAAFQLALWEAAYEADGEALDLTGGKFTAAGTTSLGSAAATLAGNYLDFVLGQVPTLYNVTFLRSDDGQHQDLVSASPIPLPAAAWLLIGGIGMLAAARRRRPETAA